MTSLRVLRLVLAALLCVLCLPRIELQARLLPPFVENITRAEVFAALSSTTKGTDYSKEAVVIERYSTRAVFQADGTATREITVVVRVQAQAGVQDFAVLRFPYTSTNEDVDLEYVRVREPDGTVVVTPPSNIQDMPADVTRFAPMYSDIHEKHVTVKALGVGDILEYRVHYRTLKPQISGQFWFGHSFANTAIVKDEELEINVPRDKFVKISSPDLQSQVIDDGPRRIYTWKTANLEHVDSETRTPKREGEQPSVQITTFRSWEEVGRWYGDLQKGQVIVTPQIRAKAIDLIKGLNSDEGRIRALYNFVSTRFHYISLSFGVGRYQPHPADEVLGNQYGDCKDKHTLLAALLKAAGYDAWPALINSSRKVDLDVPSPGQFDHVITVVPRGNDLVWLDTTPEVAPFAVLLGNLRDKQALVIPTEKAASMMKTPEIPPIASRLTFNADGKLGPDGTLTAHVERTAGGDVAIVYRIEFRRVPQVRWKELVQQISYSSGFAGEVSAVDASPPDDIDQLFRFSYDYTRKNYGDWENRRVTLPLPPFGIELSGTEEKKPTEPPFLGSTGERVSQARIELPSGSTAIIPEKVDVTQDFAEYHATYSFTNGTLTAERRLVIKKAEVPLIAWDKYQNFRKVVTDDRDRWIQLDGLEGKSATAKTSDSEGESKVEQLLDQAYSANQAGEYQTALNLYGEALKLDPKHPTAWNDIGRMQLRLGLTSEAIKSLQRQVAINPQDEFVYRNLARAYLALGDDEQAKTACLTQIRMRPLDDFCNLIVGRILVEQRKYSEAIPLLETAARIMPNEPTIPLDLGIARLYLGDNDAAYRDFKRALDMGKIPFIWIGVANALSDRGLRPDEALQYATSAADVTAGLLQAMIQQKQYKDAWALSEELVLAWDSVALAQFRRRELAKAEKFASSAWNNRLFAETGHHLGVIYEAMGAPNRAANVYEDVLLYFPKSPLTQTRLQTILGGQQEAEAALKARRSSALSPVLVLSTTAQDDASDDVWLLLGSHGSVVDLQFVEIAHSLDRFTDAIRAHKFEADIVDDKTPALVRRGRVACSRQGGCTFFLLPGGLNESVSGIERDLAGTARK